MVAAVKSSITDLIRKRLSFHLQCMQDTAQS